MDEKKIAVKTVNLTRRFGDFTAVNRVSIEVYQGEIFGFLGANGAGKTTMIRMLCGLLIPSEGEATVAGYDVFRENERIKMHIGYMSQKFSLYNDLTLSENFQFYGGIYGLSKEMIEQKQDFFFKEFGLAAFADYRTEEVPLGYKQRLALACALLHDPTIVFLDEPTSGVDPRARRSFWEVIHQTAGLGKTVFVTTHYMEEAEYCHRVSIMHEGRIVALGSPAELKRQHRQSSMQDVFLHVIRNSNNAAIGNE